MNTDPIADLLTRIRNAHGAKQEYTTIPHSRLKMEIVQILEQHGFLKGSKLLQDKKFKEIKVLIPQNKKILTLKRVSKPGRRVYKKASELTSSLNGFGIFVVSTSSGLMTSDEAKAKNIGGEIICEIY